MKRSIPHLIVALAALYVIFSFCVPAVSVGPDKSEESKVFLRLFAFYNMLNDYREQHSGAWPQRLRDMGHDATRAKQIEKLKPDGIIYNPPPAATSGIPDNWILLASSTSKATLTCSLDGKIIRLPK